MVGSLVGRCEIRRGKREDYWDVKEERELKETLEEKKENNDEVITKRRKAEISQRSSDGMCLLVLSWTVLRPGREDQKEKARQRYHGVQQDTTAEIYLDARGIS